MSNEIKIETLKANGMEYRVRTAGMDQDGELVIFLHGFPESSKCWEKAMLKLADEGYRCLAPDQRGFSAGARPEGMENYTYPHLTKDVLGFADAVGVPGKFHLVTHDLGACVGWALLCYDDSRIQSFVSLATPYNAALYWAMEHDEEQAKKSSYIKGFLEPGTAEDSLLANDQERLKRIYTGFDQEFIDDYLEVLSTKEACTGALNWYRGTLLLPEENKVPYKDIQVPTVYVWGTQDLALGRTAAEKTGDFCKGYYKFVELDCTHWMMEFSEPECSAIIMEHVKQFPISE